LSKTGYLLDVNLLFALLSPDHVHYKFARKWLISVEQPWGTCSFSEAGYLRLAMSPRAGGHSLRVAGAALESLTQHPQFRFWPITKRWSAVTASLSGRVYGHQQITDAYLLGLAIQENGILATLDKGIRHLAGERHAKHVLVLE
jgi:toxin-antitoxin system PIN domain toxin